MLHTIHKMSLSGLLLTLLVSLCGSSRLDQRPKKEYVPHGGLPPLPLPSLDVLCSGREGAVFTLPWDCKGYVRCQYGAALWSSCPLDTRSVDHKMDPICITEEAKCRMKSRDRWQAFCVQRGRDPYPSETDCAGYYDCRVGEEGVERQCPYPQLFNPTTFTCEDFRVAEGFCGNRHIPKAPCEYRENQICKSIICLPCEDRWPSCRPEEDGYQEIRPQYSWYLKCESGRSIDVLKCPDGQVFSTVLGCTASITAT